MVVEPPQLGCGGAPPEMQSVRVVSPSNSPQNPGASQAQDSWQSLVCTDHVFDVEFQIQLQDPEQGAGVVVVDVVDETQQIRRCSPSSAWSAVGVVAGGSHE